MGSVVFMRGVNVGGKNRFRPAELARALADLDVVSIGAAGTFVVRKTASQAKLKSEFLRHLPFEPEMMICRAADVLEIIPSDPFSGSMPKGEVRPHVSVLAKAPQQESIKFPLDDPPSRSWQVRLIDRRGRYILSWRRKIGKRLIYPNETVEREFKLPATTRNWDTFLKIERVLKDP